MLEEHILRKDDQLITNFLSTLTEEYARRICYSFMDFSNDNLPKSNTVIIYETSTGNVYNESKKKSMCPENVIHSIFESCRSKWKQQLEKKKKAS